MKKQGQRNNTGQPHNTTTKRQQGPEKHYPRNEQQPRRQRGNYLQPEERTRRGTITTTTTTTPRLTSRNRRAKTETERSKGANRHSFETLDKQPESDDDTQTVEPTTKHKCLLVADSNRRKIIPFLDRNIATWHHENDIFTTEQLQNWSNNPPQEYDHIVIVQSTNYIRYEKDGYRIAKNDLPHKTTG